MIGEDDLGHIMYIKQIVSLVLGVLDVYVTQMVYQQYTAVPWSDHILQG